jgi:hypothetical protein
MNASPVERNLPRQVCTTCGKPITTRNNPRCMLCGAPTHAGCSVSGFCKADIDKLLNKGGDQLAVIDREIKREKRNMLIALFAFLGMMLVAMIVFYTMMFKGKIPERDFVNPLAVFVTPALLLELLMVHYKNKMMAAIRERDKVIRGMCVDFVHFPREVPPGSNAKPGSTARPGINVPYTCSSCHGPMHVDGVSCMLCLKSLCSKCNEGSLCPTHAAALTTEDRERLPKAGDFTSKILQYTAVLGIAIVNLTWLLLAFLLPVMAYLALVLVISVPLVYKYLSIMVLRRRLSKKSGTTPIGGTRDSYRNQRDSHQTEE